MVHHRRFTSTKHAVALVSQISGIFYSFSFGLVAYQKGFTNINQLKNVTKDWFIRIYSDVHRFMTRSQSMKI
jgi:hypothetical protein